MTEPLWLPDDALLELQVEETAKSHQRAAAELEQRLRRDLDPNLRVFLAKPGADDPRLEPGYWHVVRLNDGFADGVWTLRNPDGSYREPGEWVVGEMKERDMWNPEIGEKLRTEGKRQAAARKRQAAADREAQKDNVEAAYRAAQRVAGDGGMTRRRWGAGRVKGIVGS